MIVTLTILVVLAMVGVVALFDEIERRVMS